MSERCCAPKLAHTQACGLQPSRPTLPRHAPDFFTHAHLLARFCCPSAEPESTAHPTSCGWQAGGGSTEPSGRERRLTAKDLAAAKESTADQRCTSAEMQASRSAAGVERARDLASSRTKAVASSLHRPPTMGEDHEAAAAVADKLWIRPLLGEASETKWSWWRRSSPANNGGNQGGVDHEPGAIPQEDGRRSETGRH